MECWRCEDVGDVECWGFRMFRMWDVRNVECSRYGMSGCGMMGMWDVWDIRDVGCCRCGMLIYKMPISNGINH